MTRWLKKAFKIENIPLIVAFFASVLVGFLDVIGQFNKDDLPSVILFCLSALMIGLIIERVSYFEQIEQGLRGLDKGKQVSSIYGVYQGRNELPPYAEFIKDAREQVVVISIDLGETATRYMDYLSEIANRRIYVRLLVFDPESQIMGGVAKLRGTTQDDMRNQIGTSLRLIDQYCSRLPSWQRSYIQVRTFDWIPTWGGISVDPGSSGGKLLVDVFQYGAAKGTWPELELRPNIGDGKLYDFYSKWYLRAWNDSKTWKMNSGN